MQYNMKIKKLRNKILNYKYVSFIVNFNSNAFQLLIKCCTQFDCKYNYDVEEWQNRLLHTFNKYFLSVSSCVEHVTQIAVHR